MLFEKKIMWRNGRLETTRDHFQLLILSVAFTSSQIYQYRSECTVHCMLADAHQNIGLRFDVFEQVHCMLHHVATRERYNICPTSF